MLRDSISSSSGIKKEKKVSYSMDHLTVPQIEVYHMNSTNSVLNPGIDEAISEEGHSVSSRPHSVDGSTSFSETCSL